MALIKCKQCGNDVAKDAKTCPKCGTGLKMGAGKKVSIVVGGLVLLGMIGKAMGGKDTSPAAASTKVAQESGKADNKQEPASGVQASAASAPASAAASFDAIGSTKIWSEISVTLKEAAVQGKVAKVTLLLKNGKTEEEKISSMLFFHVTSEEGDQGDLDIMDGTSCDGAVPPQGLLKCKLAYKFEKTPKELTIRVGAGVVSDTVYFKVIPTAK